MPILAGYLIQKSQLEVVSSSTKLSDAFNIMVENHFSQLPIVGLDNVLIGLVTTESIARALINFNVPATQLTVNDAVVTPKTIQVDEDLMELLDDFMNSASEAVLIINKSKILFGLITYHDITRYLQERAEYNILLGEIEKSMKDHIRFAYNSDFEPQSDALQQAIDNLNNNSASLRAKAKTLISQIISDKSLNETPEEIEKRLDTSFPLKKKSIQLDKLTLGDFIQLIQNKEAWELLSSVFNTSKNGWSAMMNEVREIRNDYSHFRNNFSSEERYKVRFCADWYKAHQPLQHKDLEATTNIDQIIPLNIADKAQLTDTKDLLDASSDLSNSSHVSTLYNKFHNSLLANVWSNSFSRIEKEVESSIEDKYQPFVSFLLNDLKDSTAIFETEIDFIEETIKQPLPKAAREHAGWWTEYSAQSRQWLLAGWAVKSVNLLKQRLLFHRWSYIIDKSDAAQVKGWANKLSTTEEDLIELINKVGAQSTIVEYYLTGNPSS